MADVPAHRAGGRAIAEAFSMGASLLKERDHVIRIPRLFRNASSQESK